MITNLLTSTVRRPHLGVRVVSLVCTVTIAILMAAIVSSLQLASRSLQDSLAVRLELLSWELAREAGNSLSAGDRGELDRISNAFLKEHGEISALRMSPSSTGDVWFQTDGWDRLGRKLLYGDQTAVAVAAHGSNLRALARVWRNDEIVGHVGMEFDLSEVGTLRTRLAWWLSGLGALLLGIAALVVTVYMRRSVTAPLRNCGEVLTIASARLSRISDDMLEISSGTSEKARVVSETSLNMSTHIQSVATAVGQLSASISDISENAAESARVGDAAVQIANETNATVERLGKSSSEIGSVIRIINSIAEQTNLLALNATIEAARAGDAGRGFAVVAAQVKELARATSDATEDISKRILSIQENTGSAIKAIEEISEVSGRIERMQTSIAAAVEEQAVTTSDIDNNIRQAADGAEDIALSIRELAQAAEGTAVTLSASQEAADQLSEIASQLRNLVG